MNKQHRTRSIAAAIAFALAPAAALFAPHNASAANGTWTRTSSGGLWSTTSNWSGSTIADGADAVADFSTLNITGNNTVHLDSARTIGSLLFGDTTPSNNWILDNNGSSANTLTLAVSSGSPTVTVSSTITATISAAITGNQGLTKAGTGTLVLSGNNSYSGATLISGSGTLQIGSSSALATSALTFDSNTGGTLDLNSFDVTVTGLSGNALALIFDNSATAGTTTFTINSAAANTFSGVIADGVSRAVALNLTGGGTLTLSGLNSYSGGTTIDSGTLIITDTNSLGSDAGVLTINNGTLRIPTASGNITENRLIQLASAASTIQVDPGITFTIASSLQDFVTPGNLNKTGTGSLILSDPGFYTGDTKISGGNITLADPLAIQSSTLDYNNYGGTLSFGSLTAATFGGLKGAQSLALGNITLSVGFNNTDTTYTGVLSGAGAKLIKVGTGNLTLTSANSYTGTTTIAGGSIIVTNSASIGSVTGGNVTISDGGTLDLSGASGTLNFGARQFFIAGAGADGVSGAIVNNSATAQQSAFQNISLAADAAIGGSRRYDLRGGAALLDLNTHTLTKTGSNQFSIVAGTIQDGGSINVAQGILSLETSTITAGAGNITYQPGTVAQFFQNSGTSITWTLTFMGNNLIGNGSGTLATIPAPIVLKGDVTFVPLNSGISSPASNNPLTLTGNITQSGGNFALTKQGANTLTLGGTNNWTGPTNIQQGTLLLNSNGALPAGAAVTLGSDTNSATLDLNGHSVTISSLTTSGTGAVHVIGNSSSTPATIFYSGGNSTYDGTIGFGGGTPPLSLVINSGILTLTGSNLYTGGTTLNPLGTLSVSTNPNLGSATAPLSFSGGTLQVTGTSFNNTTRPINWSALGGAFDIADPSNLFVVNSPLSGGGLTKSGPGTLSLTQPYTTTSPTIINAGTLMLAGSASGVSSTSIITGSGNLSIASSATSLVSDYIRLNSLSINGFVQIRSNGFNTSLLNSLSFAGGPAAPTGMLDLTNNKLIIQDSANHAATLADIQAETAYGTANGTGIFSSTLLAGQLVVVVDNAVAGLTSFGGAPVDNGSILLLGTYAGDATLDGQVTINDLAALLGNWQKPATGYTQADFTNDGKVTINDLAVILGNWQKGAGSSILPLSPQFSVLSTSSSVPEPTSLTFLFALPLLLRRRNY